VSDAPHASTVRILAWNLRHGGGNTRTPEQALFINSQAPDIVVLSEYREGRGSQLRAMLADEGLTYVLSPKAPPTRNRVAMLSRWPIVPLREEAWQPRLLCALIPSIDTTLIAAHVPDESDETRRAATWQGVVGLAREFAGGNALVAGDFNTARTGIDAQRSGQTCERWMGELATAGFRDCMVEHARRTCEPLAPSWFGPLGERARIDGIWASSTLFHQFESASQDTSCITNRLSDHTSILALFSIARSPLGDRATSDSLSSSGLFPSHNEPAVPDTTS